MRKGGGGRLEFNLPHTCMKVIFNLQFRFNEISDMALEDDKGFWTIINYHLLEEVHIVRRR